MGALGPRGDVCYDCHIPGSTEAFMQTFLETIANKQSSSSRALAEMAALCHDVDHRGHPKLETVC